MGKSPWLYEKAGQPGRGFCFPVMVWEIPIASMPANARKTTPVGNRLIFLSANTGRVLAVSATMCRGRMACPEDDVTTQSNDACNGRNSRRAPYADYLPAPPPVAPAEPDAPPAGAPAAKQDYFPNNEELSTSSGNATECAPPLIDGARFWEFEPLYDPFGRRPRLPLLPIAAAVTAVAMLTAAIWLAWLGAPIRPTPAAHPDPAAATPHGQGSPRDTPAPGESLRQPHHPSSADPRTPPGAHRRTAPHRDEAPGANRTADAARTTRTDDNRTAHPDDTAAHTHGAHKAGPLPAALTDANAAGGRQETADHPDRRARRHDGPVFAPTPVAPPAEAAHHHARNAHRPTRHAPSPTPPSAHRSGHRPPPGPRERHGHHRTGKAGRHDAGHARDGRGDGPQHDGHGDAAGHAGAAPTAAAHPAPTTRPDDTRHRPATADADDPLSATRLCARFPRDDPRYPACLRTWRTHRHRTGL